jgi:hypothetical protein
MMPATADASPPVASGTGLSQWLRYGGLLAMLGAIASFLLQGFASEMLALRSWFGLGAISLCAAGGWLCYRAFADRAGVRLLFALALLFVPAQFAHLSSLLVELRQVAPGDAGALADLPSALTWLLQVGCSTALAGLVALTGFRVLARATNALPATAWIGLNALLLIPVREGGLGLVLPVLLMLLTPVVARLRARGPAAIGTLEQFGLRLALYLPAIIATTRYTLTQELVLAMPFLTASLGVMLMLLARACGSAVRTGAVLHFVGVLSVSLGWLLFSIFQLYALPELWAVSVALLPIIGFTLWQAHTDGPAPRSLAVLAMLWLMPYCTHLFDQGVLPATALLCLLSAALATLGWVRRLRWLMLVGGTIAVLAIAQLLWLSLAEVAFSGWLLLGVLGLGLVLAAGAVERFGRSA